MIKATSKKSIETKEAMKFVLDVARGGEVTIGNGKVVWVLSSAFISSVGGYSKERGVYPSAIALLKRRGKFGEIIKRHAHLHELRLAK